MRIDRTGYLERRLAEALDEVEIWRRLAPLLPFAVHRDHRAERALARIPRQRRPVDLWPPNVIPRPAEEAPRARARVRPAHRAGVGVPASHPSARRG